MARTSQNEPGHDDCCGVDYHFPGVFGEDGEAVRSDVGEAALDLEADQHRPSWTVTEAFLERGHERRMPGQDAEVALRPRRIDLIDVAR